MNALIIKPLNLGYLISNAVENAHNLSTRFEMLLRSHTQFEHQTVRLTQFDKAKALSNMFTFVLMRSASNNSVLENRFVFIVSLLSVFSNRMHN